MNDFYLILIYGTLFFIVLFIAEFTYSYLHWASEVTRKVAHIGAGIISLTYPHFGDSHWVIFVLSFIFFVFLLFSKHYGYFPSIFDINRKSIGEILFVWNIWLLFVLFKTFNNDIYFYLPLSIVVFADSFAALVGYVLPIKKFKLIGSQKSLGGSITFFIITMFLSFLLIPAANYDEPYLYLFVFVFSVVISFVEVISFSGFDNMSVPVMAIILLYFYFN